MKQRILIWVMSAVFLSACHRPAVETVHAPSPELEAIDTLMQTQPDSALVRLLEAPVDDPYYQLLFSEALYKNDSAQLNRMELLEAMAYYDSIDDAFLAARCHYMNGVGYYEMDSVIQACAEYLSALEIMEDHFQEEELVGHKAKFMALTYTHLSLLFSDEYLPSQVIYFGNRSLSYYSKYDAEPWHIAWMLTKIGSHYEIMEQWDSACCYYQKAIDVLPDTNSLMYRDISGHLALLQYKINENAEIALEQMYRLVVLSDSEVERLIRYSFIGEIYYHEIQYDSSWKYLNKVYLKTTNTALKKQAAEWLIEICKSQDRCLETFEYADYLAQFATQNEIQGGVKSMLSELFLQYEKSVQDRSHKNKLTKFWKLTGVVLGCFVLFFLILGIFLSLKNKRGRLYQEKQIAELTEKWNDTKKTLLKEREAAIAAEKTIKANSFIEEPICAYILELVKSKNFKAKIDCINYKESALDNNQILELRNAANMHYGCLLKTLKERFPKLTDDDLNYCCLYLLGLKEADIAALMQRSFSTVCYRSRKIKGVFNTKEPLSVSLYNFINFQ